MKVTWIIRERLPMTWSVNQLAAIREGMAPAPAAAGSLASEGERKVSRTIAARMRIKGAERMGSIQVSMWVRSKLAGSELAPTHKTTTRNRFLVAAAAAAAAAASAAGAAL